MRKRSPSTSSSTSSSSTSSYSNSSNSSSTNSSGSSSSTCSSSSNDRPRKDKKKVTVQKPKGVLKRKHKKKVSKVNEVEDKDDVSADVPIDLMGQAKDMAPMTKEQWDKQQSVTKKVYDESTGRHRLIKGDGEVIEEIVSKERHKAINKIATKGDGDFFQQNVSSASFK
ncbi:hypothetical protein RN001_004419 [Aquatica leii]|uniref:ADP-ribosylation factor-like protein 6-interacting protein 4 n=1 Tax=Aquatica leii TaxID=1421715 RepID=A0AAN7SRP5_9COLE|nr:hypothetical protein RN001_004419 [Aquatica leii]